MVADRNMIDLVLKTVPQQYPFRFIDGILELDEDHIVGSYRFREDEYFYQGHFPGRPVTPGVILIEAMGQMGVGAFGIYLAMTQWNLSQAEIEGMMTLFTHVENVEFTGVVPPGETVIIRGEKIYLRRRNLKSRVSMTRESGEEVCSGILGGMAVIM